MKRNLFASTMMALVIVTFFSACSKHETTTPSSPKFSEEVKNPFQKLQVTDHVIEFSDVSHFNNTLKEIVGIPEERILTLTENANFKSFLRAYYNTLIDLNNEKIERTDDKVIKFIDHNNFVTKNLAQRVVAALINEDGILKVGKAIYYFDQFGQIIIADGSLEKLSRAKLQRHTAIEEGVYVFDKAEVVAERAACGSFQSITVQNGDRRATISSELIFVFTILDVNRVRAQVFDNHEGFPEKRNFLGRWVNYKATQNILELNYSVRLFNGSRFPNTYASTNDWYLINYSRLLVDREIGQEEKGNYQGIFTYINVNRYKHLGMNDNWAVINCN